MYLQENEMKKHEEFNKIITRSSMSVCQFFYSSFHALALSASRISGGFRGFCDSFLIIFSYNWFVMLCE